jgi:hypothetical protein
LKSDADMKPRGRKKLVWLTAGGVVVILVASVLAWGKAHHARESAPLGSADTAGPTLHVPRTPAPIVLTADTEGRHDWEGDNGNTQNFKDDAGNGIVPYTEAKVRWSSDKLYFLLYAGDLDLEGSVTQHDGPVEKDDSFHLEFGSGQEWRKVSVSLLGTVADALCTGALATRTCDPSWESHAEVASDRDGTMNHIGDNDEEWVIEMAIPFSALGVTHAGPGTRIPFSISRCEVGHGPHGCGGWGKGGTGTLVLDP